MQRLALPACLIVPGHASASDDEGGDDMPDGDGFILGSSNSASSETRLTRSGGTANPALYARNENGVGISGESQVIAPATRGIGVEGRSNLGYGVVGNSPSDGAGVRGESASGTGVEAVSDGGAGIRAESRSGPGVTAESNSGLAVAGRSFAHHGVLGTSTSRFGVVGDSVSAAGVVGTSSRSNGVEGYSSQRVGVKGASQSWSGVVGTSSTSIGVEGFSSGQIGVEGTSKTGKGVVGFSNAGVGVQGYTALAGMDASRPGTGVAGRSDSGIGVRGDSISGTGIVATSSDFVAIRAHSNGHIIGGSTVHATAENDCIYAGSKRGSGVFGISDYGTGVHGTVFRSGVGVLATTPAGIAVRAAASLGIGVFASSPNDTAVLAATSTGVAGVFFGKVNVAGPFTVFGGSKSAAVPHPDGSHRRLYSLEAPESWFEDFGRADLVHGQADVELDPDFVAVVRSDDYHVFLTPEGDSAGLFVSSRTSTGFEVREQQGGESTLVFSYRLVAKRGDIEGPRFEKVEPPEPPEAEEPRAELPEFPAPPPGPPEPPEQRDFPEPGEPPRPSEEFEAHH
jgi:hypothetical protein